MMKKLMAMKTWLPVEDAAAYLSLTFDESVTPADVLRFGLDGPLQLSVLFSEPVFAKPGRLGGRDEGLARGRPIKIAPIPVDAMLKHHSTRSVDLPIDVGDDRHRRDNAIARPALIVNSEGRGIVTDRFFLPDHAVAKLIGVYDLSMLGNERTTVEREYHHLTDGQDIGYWGINGGLVKGTDGQLYQIQYHRADALERDRKPIYNPWDHPDNFNPDIALPSCSRIVVRVDALKAFAQGFAAESEKPLGTTERNTMLTVLAAVLDYSAIDPAFRGAASQIAAMTEQIGAPVTDDTVRKILGQIPAAVESRKKK
jgi:hypothetical protein